MARFGRAFPIKPITISSINVFQPLAIIVADSGSGTEGLTLSVSVFLNESSTGNDVVLVSNPFLKSILDAGVGTDSVAVINEIIITDTGSGAETVIGGVNVALVDSGGAADTVSLQKYITENTVLTIKIDNPSIFIEDTTLRIRARS